MVITSVTTMIYYSSNRGYKINISFYICWIMALHVFNVSFIKKRKYNFNNFFVNKLFNNSYFDNINNSWAYWII